MSRIAFVHDWLTGMRGGEKCLERFVTLFPNCEIFTLFHRRGSTSPSIESRPIHTSWLQKLPAWDRYYRYLLPVFPHAATWNLDGFDLVVSLSHCVAKAAISPPGIPHLCYCFTPMRYAWHMRDQYFRESNSLKERARAKILGRLREWDRATSDRVSQFIAISQTVANRIDECYQRSSSVIAPPVDVDFYCPAAIDREDYYLVVSALAPYKRIDLAIDACRCAGKRLVIIGTGQDSKRLIRSAGADVSFLGWQSNDAIRDHMRRCRALLFPGEEDFGIVPVEAQACGTPVIAFGRGGATETVVDIDQTNLPPTGLLFAEQTAECLAECIECFEKTRHQLDAVATRKWVMQFSEARFDAEIRALVAHALNRPGLRQIAA